MEDGIRKRAHCMRGAIVPGPGFELGVVIYFCAAELGVYWDGAEAGSCPVLRQWL